MLGHSVRAKSGEKGKVSIYKLRLRLVLFSVSGHAGPWPIVGQRLGISGDLDACVGCPVWRKLASSFTARSFCVWRETGQGPVAGDFLFFLFIFLSRLRSDMTVHDSGPAGFDRHALIVMAGAGSAQCAYRNDIWNLFCHDVLL